MNRAAGTCGGEVLVLLSVFIPTAFFPALPAKLYKQFALTIAVSTAFSGFNALTFTLACALCSCVQEIELFFLYRWFNKGFGANHGPVYENRWHLPEETGVAITALSADFGRAFWHS